MDAEIKEFIEQGRREHKEKIFFIEQGLGADIHWFFTQGFQALKNDLYLPACSSFIIGIEASLRITLSKLLIPISGRVRELDRVKTLSNKLLICGREEGIPINLLAFTNESDFNEKLSSKKPNIQNVEIVRVRHNLCHGNILEYVNTELGEQNVFFTPECCRELATSLYDMSKSWTKGLGEFYREKFNV